MFEGILVAVDGSRHSDLAFDIALEMARKFDSTLFVLHVYPGTTGHGLLVSGQEEDTFRAAGQSILDTYARKLNKTESLKVRMLLSKGKPAERILDAANEKKCDLIVLGSRGKGGLSGLVLGSISNKIANSSERPVLIAR